MKTTVAACLADWVTKTHGPAVWQEVMRRAGLPPDQPLDIAADQPDELAFALFAHTGSILHLSQREVYEEFGYHWMSHWMQTLYRVYLKDVNSFRDLILKLDSIHNQVTNNIPNAHPPRFYQRWTDANTLELEYRSRRNLLDFFIAIARSAIRFYGDHATVETTGINQVRIVWQPQPVLVG